MAEVQRFDLACFSPRTTRTPQGFLKAPAFFTRAGIFEYKRADGSTIRELRPEEEVFKKDSLATLSNAPLTLDHPEEGMVNPQNAKKLSIGFSGEKVSRKDSLVEGTVIVMDAEAISNVSSGKLKEISMGYTCSIERTAGHDPKHGRYDQIQRNIRYNHVALGEPNWGRAGNDVGIRLDSEGAIQRSDAFSSLELLINQQLDLRGMSRVELAEKTRLNLFELEDIIFGFLTPKKEQLSKIASAIEVDVEVLIGLVPRVDRADSIGSKKIMEEKTIVIGGVEFTVPKNAAQAFEAELQRKDAEAEKLQGRFDAQSEELKKVKEKVDELSDEGRFDSAVNERIELVNKARKVLGEEAEVVGSKREVMEKVLKHDKADLDLEGKSDDYVEARFDAYIDTFQQTRASESKSKTRVAAHNARATDTARVDSREARAKMIQENQEAWKQNNRDQLLGRN